MKRKLFLITGCGFIGFNLIENLNLKNFQINLFGKKGSIKVKKDIKDIKLFNFDIFDLKKLDNFNFQNSYIILSILGTNKKKFKLNFKNLIEYLSKRNIKRLILLSSVSVYGNSNPKISLLNKYANSCFYSEKIVTKYFEKYLILRISNLFGKYKKNPGTIEKLIMTNLNIKKFSFLNENITRSYLSIEEFSSIIKKLILKNINGIYDLSNKNYVYNMKNLKKSFKKFYNNKIEYRKLNIKPKIINSIIKSTKLLKLINHENKNNFLLDLKKVDNFYRNIYKKN